MLFYKMFHERRHQSKPIFPCFLYLSRLIWQSKRDRNRSRTGKESEYEIGCGFLDLGKGCSFSIGGRGADFCRSSPPRLLRSHPSEGGELDRCYVTYYVSRIYKERINAFPTEIGTKNCVPYRFWAEILTG